MHAKFSRVKGRTKLDDKETIWKIPQQFRVDEKIEFSRIKQIVVKVIVVVAYHHHRSKNEKYY